MPRTRSGTPTAIGLTTTGMAYRMGRDKPTYWYQSTPSPVVLNGFLVTQKGRSFHVVKAKVADIDRLCKVPVLPYDQNNDAIASWVLSSHSDQWQRELDPDRVTMIADFFKAPGNFLVNSAVVSLPITPEMVNVVDDKVSIRMPVTWTVKQCPKCGYTPDPSHPYHGWSFDACPSVGPDGKPCEWDGRPGEIVDGQHRIRGAASARSPHWDETIVATVLTSDRFSKSEMAKIFTEITTSVVDLDPLHKLCLLYKFSLPAKDIGRLRDADFRKTTPTPPARNTIGLRNRRAYEITCALCELTNSRWWNRITILPSLTGGARRGDTIDADRMVYYLEQWLRPDEVLSDDTQPDGMFDRSKAVQYLQDYLEAWLNIWPTGTGTPSRTSTWFWNENRATNGVLQERGIFEVFLQMFPVVTGRILGSFAVPTPQAYTEHLRYIESIDWNDPAWSDLGSPDKNKDMLLNILTHIFDNAPRPVGPNRLPPWVNSWIKGQPDEFVFTATPPSTITCANASDKTPLRFRWESISGITGNRISKPVNAYKNASISLSQMQGGRRIVLFQDSTDKNEYTIDSPPAGLDTSRRAAMVELTVVYSKGNQTRTLSHMHPAA